MRKVYNSAFADPCPEPNAWEPLTLAAFDQIDIESRMTNRKVAGRKRRNPEALSHGPPSACAKHEGKDRSIVQAGHRVLPICARLPEPPADDGKCICVQAAVCQRIAKVWKRACPAV